MFTIKEGELQVLAALLLDWYDEVAEQPDQEEENEQALIKKLQEVSLSNRQGSSETGE